MQSKTPLKFILLALGIALLFAGLFFDDGMADSAQLQADVTATPDRLAQPTLPATPSQADHGAEVYWLSCLPCHGDKGQGLTDEFRTTYPPEEQYCWERGCHGEVPYENGFKLPMTIPAVIGDNTLAKFADAAQLNAYIRATMPYWNPGSLAEEDAWRVTAFILRANNLWDGRTELNATNAAGVKIARGAVLTPVATPPPAEVRPRENSMVWLVLAGILVSFLLVMFILKKIRNTTTI
ncbi:MAG TPA: c-type cytochrome [Anaerolineales bacterium]|nr:c-type cytochrome [Anaerolineales bacterium]